MGGGSEDQTDGFKVRNNPKEKTVHFGGLKGQATRQKYMEMTYTTSAFPSPFPPLVTANDDISGQGWERQDATSLW